MQILSFQLTLNSDYVLSHEHGLAVCPDTGDVLHEWVMHSLDVAHSIKVVRRVRWPSSLELMHAQALAAAGRVRSKHEHGLTADGNTGRDNRARQKHTLKWNTALTPLGLVGSPTL